MVASAKQTPAVIDESPTAAAPAGEAAVVAKKKPRSKAPIFGLILIAGLTGGIAYWTTQRGLESTDDAQVDGEVVAVPARIGGTVTKVFFAENQHVKKGDLLAQLDDAPAKARLAQAEASLEVMLAAAEASDAETIIARSNAKGNKAVSQAALTTASVGAKSASDQIREAEASLRSSEASQKQAESERDRSKSLFDSGAVTRSVLDQAQTAYDVASSNLEGSRARLATLRATASEAQSRIVEASAKAEQSNDVDAVIKQADARTKSAHAQVDSAKAALELAKLELSYTTISAPDDGVVSKKSIHEGQSVGAGQTIVQLVTPTLWITGNFKETQMQKMRVDEPAEFEVDSFPGIKLHGSVESFSAATGARFTLLPPDNASGNFTKVVQRVPIRVRIANVPPGVELRPGMSVDLTINTR